MMKGSKNSIELWNSKSDALQTSVYDSGGGYPAQIQEVIHILESSAVLSKLPDLKKFRVLDVGAGGGRWSRMFSNKVQSITAIEPSEIYPILVDRLATFKNITCLNQSFQDFNSDELFDLIIVSGVLMYLTDEQEVEDFLKKASGLLKNQGYLVLREPVVRSKKYLIDWVYTTEDVRQKLANCQYWEVLRSERFYVLTSKSYNLKIVDSFISHAPFFTSMNPANKGLGLMLNFLKGHIHKRNLKYIKVYNKLFRTPYGLISLIRNSKCYKICIFKKETE